MIVFDGTKTEINVVLEAEEAMDNGWDFCSTKKEDILITRHGCTSQVKLTEEIQVCEVS
jgi:hypothetical protein